jgi:hypothetical protein
MDPGVRRDDSLRGLSPQEARFNLMSPFIALILYSALTKLAVRR